jgi:transposase InsO family protein
MDHEQGDDSAWYEQQDDPPLLNPDFDLCGDYCHSIVYKSNLSSDAYTHTGRILVHDNDVFFDTQGDEAFVDAHSNEHDDNDVDTEVATDRCVFRANAHHYVCSATTYPDADSHPNHHGPHMVAEAPHDYDALHPRFTWLPTDIIKKTFDVTTQYARMPLNTILRKCFKSPNPAVNVRRRDEPMATDTIQSDVPAIYGGEKYEQIFVGTTSLVTDVHGMKSPAQFPGVLTDEIITCSAPTKLISDSAHVETSKEVRGILRTYGISSWQSEPHQQHQNPAERRYQTVKRLCNTIPDLTGALAYCWLLCLMYVCFMLNNTFLEVIQSTPLCQAYGTDNDISPMFYFSFYQPVYYLVDETTFPSESKELYG